MRSWSEVHKDLGKVLRKISTRQAQEHRRCEDRANPSSGTVPTAGNKKPPTLKTEDEQICSH